MKLTNINVVTNKVIGKRGSPKREAFEYELQMDVLGQIIKDARKNKNLSQEQLGLLVGVQKAQISKLENNFKNFRIDTMVKVLESLGAKVKLTVEFDR